MSDDSADRVERGSTAPCEALATRRRIPELDGLRGAAALIVVFWHTVLVLHVSGPLATGLLAIPLAWALNATGAVHVFFVLSGFVLARSLSGELRLTALPAFYARRVFRLYPPYMAALLFAWGASFLYVVPAPVGLSSAYALLASIHLEPLQVLRFLTFPSDAGLQLSVGWSLNLEMKYSLLLPALLWVALRWHWTLPLLLFVGGLRGGWSPVHLVSVQGFFLCSLSFTLGMALFIRASRWDAWLGRGRHGWVPLLVGAMLFGLPRWLGWQDFQVSSSLLMSLGAGGLVLGALTCDGARRALSGRAILWLGKISYSLYLVHLPVLILLGGTFVREDLSLAGGLVFLAAGLAASLALAAMGYAWVERPAIAAGRRVAAWL